jgi:hypothetical protein
VRHSARREIPAPSFRLLWKLSPVLALISLRVASRIKERLDYHNKYENRPYQLSVSTGVSLYDTEDLLDIHDLIVPSDRMMYEQSEEKG